RGSVTSKALGNSVTTQAIRRAHRSPKRTTRLRRRGPHRDRRGRRVFRCSAGRITTLDGMTETAAAPIRVREDVLAVPAYRQGSAPTKPGYKLSSNENPFE